MWQDMLKEKIKATEGSDNVNLSLAFINMIIESADYTNQILTDITKLNTLITEEISSVKTPVADFIESFKRIYETEMIPITVNYKKRISINIINNINKNGYGKFLEISFWNCPIETNLKNKKGEIHARNVLMHTSGKNPICKGFYSNPYSQ